MNQPRDLSVYRDRPQVRLLVVQLLSPLCVGDEREQLSVRMPRETLRSNVHIGERGRLAATDRSDHDLGGRTRALIRRREGLSIALEVLPIEDRAFESLLMASLEGARIGGRIPRLRLVSG